MAELTLQVEVRAPVEVVWAAATDWVGQSSWVFATTVRPTHRDGRGVGGRLEAFTGVGKVGFLDPMQITSWEPPHRCVVLHLGRVVRGSAAFEVEPVGTAGARLVWTEWLVPPLGLLGQLGFLLVRPFAAAGIQRSLRTFARLVESGELPAVAA
ncbi:MAG: SRPBCC family protein [Actinomycetota bacterium]|nr:SRPBCC family protein [Actinomycetota bacterium]